MAFLPRVRRAKVKKTKYLGKEWKINFLCVVNSVSFISSSSYTAAVITCLNICILARH